MLVKIPSSESPYGKDCFEFVKSGVLNDFYFWNLDSDYTKPTETGVNAKKDN